MSSAAQSFADLLANLLRYCATMKIRWYVYRVVHKGHHIGYLRCVGPVYSIEALRAVKRMQNDARHVRQQMVATVTMLHKRSAPSIDRSDLNAQISYPVTHVMAHETIRN